MNNIDAKGTQLYAEEVGCGDPVIFVHEFADNIKVGLHKSRHSHGASAALLLMQGVIHRLEFQITRNYIPEIAARDINSVLKGYALDSAHCWMLDGSIAALHHAILFPDATKSITLISCGYGAAKDQEAAYSEEAQVLAAKYSELGSVKMAEHYAMELFGSSLKQKIPLVGVSSEQGYHNTPKWCCTHHEGCSGKRPSLYDLEEDIKRVEVPH